MLVNVVVVFLLYVTTCSCYLQFIPVDKYLINCGSLTNVSIGNRMFLSENFTQGYLITSRNVLVHTSVNSIPLSEFSQLYSTDRIFTNSSFYFFVIDQPGRHWIRLYFYPFSASGNDITTAVFSVSTSEHLLLSIFSCSNSSVKEFSVNVTSNGLQITFTPAQGSFGVLNGLEVVSVPNQLIGDYATCVDNHTNFRGLSSQALETLARVNVGGTVVSSVNDSLWRTWVPDQPFLINPSLATNVSNTNAVRYPGDGGATQEDAPRSVYGTGVKVASPKSNLNVSWEFPVESGFKYFVRLHFCDIESVLANDLYFNVYIQDWSVLTDFNLSSRLTTAYYVDFVTPSIYTNKIRISIGPSGGRYAAILNGVEIMKLNNSDGTDVPASNKRSESEAVVIVEVVVCSIVGVSIAFVLFFFIKRRMQELLNQSNDG